MHYKAILPLTCSILIGGLSPALSDGIVIFTPEWMTIPDSTLTALAAEFSEVRTVPSLHWQSDQGQFSDAMQDALSHDPDLFVVLGLDQGGLSDRQEQIVKSLDRDWNDWLTGETLSVPGSPPTVQTTDMIPLGFGFANPVNEPEAATIYVPMGWNLNVPLVSAGVYAAGGSDPNEFVTWLHETEEGDRLRRSLSIIPFEGGLNEPEITIKPWVDYFEPRYFSADGDDGCGCDDEAATCDPDTFSVPEMPLSGNFELMNDSGVGVLTVPQNGDRNSLEDGCGCEARVVWGDDLAQLRAHAAATGEIVPFSDDLQRGRQFILFTCDPD